MFIMLWVKAFHIIAMVAWFAGLFYLPRLFIYHTQWKDSVSNEHFKIMERKLYRYITTPAGIITLLLGLWLISFNPTGYLHQPWMHMKLTAVFLLVLYHLYLGRIVSRFQQDKNQHSLKLYHWLHRLPTLFLVVIVCLVVVGAGS
jgi:protoporphyrinogen IX oxidase